jgi:SAM-dependent methyltransferase
MPNLKAVSRSVILFAGFHLLGATVIAASAYIGWIKDRRHRQPLDQKQKLVFSTGVTWLNPPALFGLICIAVAIAVQVGKPELWPISYVLVAQAVVFFAGSRTVKAFRTTEDAALPMVHLFDGPTARVLDVGSGSGRSTVTFAMGEPGATIVAIDNFYGDADPALRLLRHNLQVSGLEGRVEVQTGTLNAIPFPDQSFDSVLSVNALDHRGGDPHRVLAEIFRILRPGGRMLLVVRTPALGTFAALHVLAFTLSSPRVWRKMAKQAEFSLCSEGRINNSWFTVLERPA